jgi:hypothetical protein
VFAGTGVLVAGVPVGVSVPSICRPGVSVGDGVEVGGQVPVQGVAVNVGVDVAGTDVAVLVGVFVGGAAPGQSAIVPVPIKMSCVAALTVTVWGVVVLSSIVYVSSEGSAFVRRFTEIQPLPVALMVNVVRSPADVVLDPSMVVHPRTISLGMDVLFAQNTVAAASVLPASFVEIDVRTAPPPAVVCR